MMCTWNVTCTHDVYDQSVKGVFILIPFMLEKPEPHKYYK